MKLHRFSKSGLGTMDTKVRGNSGNRRDLESVGDLTLASKSRNQDWPAGSNAPHGSSRPRAVQGLLLQGEAERERAGVSEDFTVRLTSSRGRGGSFELVDLYGF